MSIQIEITTAPVENDPTEDNNQEEEKEEKEQVIDKQLLLNSWPPRAGHVIEELLITEKTYLESMEDIINGYLKPLYEFLLQGSQGPHFIETVFCNIRKLHSIHLELYDSLLKVYSKPQEFGIAFNKHAEHFKEYTHYCTNFPLCERTLQQTIQNNPSIQQFIVQCQIQLGHPLPLITYLHKPVQRILKYRLLLEQVLKKFQENTSEQKELKKALVTMSNIANEINEVKKKQENLTRVKSIEKQLKGLKGSELSGSSLMSYGHLLHEGTCKVLGRRGGERTLLLFETMLLFLKNKGEKNFVYKGHIKVAELDLSDNLRKKTLLKLFPVHSPSRAVTVEFRSKRVKEELIGIIQSLLVSQMKRGKKKEEKDIEVQLEPSAKNNNLRLTNVARQRSLLASSDLQTRRKTRQMSTRKFADVQLNSDNKVSDHHHNKEEHSSGDSGVQVTSLNTTVEEEGMTKSVTSEDDESPRLKRRTAFRRRRVQTISAHGHNEFMSSLSTESSGSWEENEKKVIKEDDQSLVGEEHETSLDKKPRSLTFSHSELLQSTENFIYPESYHQPSLLSPEGLRKRTDTYSIPPDPIQVLGHNRMFLSGVEENFEEEREEDEDEKERQRAAVRRAIFSRHFEDSDESLGSNASSLCLEDHYFLSQTSKSAIIAGRDGENIVIYDDDSEESESSEYEEEEDEEEREGNVTQRDEEEEGQNEIHKTNRSDNAQKSLRSYLSMTNLFPSEELYESTVNSPLATLPRSKPHHHMTREGGELMASPLLYTTKNNKLQKSYTSDVLMSLPVSSHSSSSQLEWSEPFLENHHQTTSPELLSPTTPIIDYNGDMMIPTDANNMWYNEQLLVEETCELLEEQPLTLSSAALILPTADMQSHDTTLEELEEGTFSNSPSRNVSPISLHLMEGAGYTTPPPLSRQERDRIKQNRSSSAPLCDRSSAFTRPSYHHWTPSPPPVSIQDYHYTAIDMSCLLEEEKEEPLRKEILPHDSSSRISTPSPYSSKAPSPLPYNGEDPSQLRSRLVHTTTTTSGLLPTYIDTKENNTASKSNGLLKNVEVIAVTSIVVLFIGLVIFITINSG